MLLGFGARSFEAIRFSFDLMFKSLIPKGMLLGFGARSFGKSCES